MDNPLLVNERKTFGYLLRPLIYVLNDSRILGFCWSCFWVIEDLTLQVSFALFHYQDHSCGVRFLEKGCAIKLYNVGMVQFSDEQNEKHAIYIDTSMIWKYIYDKIQNSVIHIKLSKLYMHQSKAEWQLSDSTNGNYANRHHAKRHHAKGHHAERHHA